jgi:hypothetical protein
MWKTVASRSHRPVKIFPFGDNALKVMIFGTVGYGMKDGGGKEVDWAARAELVMEEEGLKMAFYQVYLVSWSGSNMMGGCELMGCRIRRVRGRMVGRARRRGRQRRRIRMRRMEGRRRRVCGIESVKKSVRLETHCI